MGYNHHHTAPSVPQQLLQCSWSTSPSCRDPGSMAVITQSAAARLHLYLCAYLAPQSKLAHRCSLFSLRLLFRVTISSFFLTTPTHSTTHRWSRSLHSIINVKACFWGAEAAFTERHRRVFVHSLLGTRHMATRALPPEADSTLTLVLIQHCKPLLSASAPTPAISIFLRLCNIHIATNMEPPPLLPPPPVPGAGRVQSA